MKAARGSVVLYLLFSIAVATASGILVYFAIRDYRIAKAEADARAPKPREQRPEPFEETVAVAEPTPTVEAVEAEPPPTVDPFDVADSLAIAPPELDQSPATNAPIFGSPGIEGTSDKAEVDRTLRRYASRLQRCFEKALAKNPRTSGATRFRFTIDRDGKVGAVTSQATSRIDPLLTTCAGEVIAKLRFARPTDGDVARVVFPIDFWPAHGDDLDVNP